MSNLISGASDFSNLWCRIHTELPQSHNPPSLNVLIRTTVILPLIGLARPEQNCSATRKCDALDCVVTANSSNPRNPHGDDRTGHERVAAASTLAIGLLAVIRPDTMSA
jgi:hypothetical protein